MSHASGALAVLALLPLLPIGGCAEPEPERPHAAGVFAGAVPRHDPAGIPHDPLVAPPRFGAFTPLYACDATLCDDGNPCTADSCSLTKGCLHRNLNRLACNDGNACTVHDRCSSGACVPGFTKTCRDGDVCTADSCHTGKGCVFVPVGCEDGNACTDDVCDPALGCFFVSANGAPCDDGNPCTSGDFCAAKKCFPGGPNPCDDGNPCTADSCDPATGCVHVAVADGTSCTDANVCNGLELCAAGVCQPGQTLLCDDGNPCTTDACHATNGCTTTAKPNGTACNDQDACTTGEKCTAATCGGGAAVTCDDQNPCTDDSCAPATGCVYTPDDTNPCDDARVCTTADRCEAADCVGDYTDGCCEADAQCDDGSACTTDTCDEPTGVCTNATDVASFFGDAFDDGSIADWSVASSNPAVTWQLHTLQKKSAPASLYLGNVAAGSYDFGATEATATSAPVPLPAWSAPTLSFAVLRLVDPAEFCPYDAVSVEVAGDVVWQECGPGGQWTDVVVDLSAYAGQVVQVTLRFETGDPGFNAGVGVFVDDLAITYAGAPEAVCCDGPADCDDGTPCTADSCEGLGQGAGFCAFVPLGVCCEAAADCDDGDPCTADACEGGVCQTAAVPDGGPCDDGDPCTAGETCAAGACGGGAPAVCPDDGDPCTVEACGEGGCAPAPADCDDGVACTLDACEPGVGCIHAPLAALCDDGAPCTADACDPASGCAHVALPDGASCAEDACSAGATCQGGACLGGGPTSCDDANPCTVDVCDPLAGCSYTLGGCDDGLACSEDLCDPAVGCVFVTSALLCADGNPCTVETCGAGGCESAPVADGVACQDPCGGAGVCDGGVCSAAPGGCDDGDPCTDDWCDITGCVSVTSLTACDDGDPCTVDACAPDTGCTHVVDAAACDDGDPCTADSCGEDGCAHAPRPDGAACDDGDPCTAAACLAGQCLAYDALSCDDGDPCTVDSCDQAGCTHAPLCDDGNPCTADACDGGACTNAAVADGAACDDGDPCTAGTACGGGACGGGAPVAGCCATDADCAAPCTAATCVEHACVTAAAPGAWWREGFDDGAADGWSFTGDAATPGFTVAQGPSASTPSALFAPVDLPGPASGQWVLAGAATPVVFTEAGQGVALRFALRTDWAATCSTWGSFVSVYVNELWVADECGTGGAWVERELDLGALLQPGAAPVQVRFELWTLDVPGNGGVGAFLDDVALVAPGASQCCTSDAACPGDDGNPCTESACSDPAQGGLCVTRFLPEGTACTGGACASGACQ